MPNIDLWMDGAWVGSQIPDPYDPEPVEFQLALPQLCFDGQEHQLEVRHCDQRIAQEFRSEYNGFLDQFSNSLLTGWVIDAKRPNTPVNVEFDLNGVTVAGAVANIYRSDLGPHGFEYRFEGIPDMHRSFIARARVAGTRIDLQKSPVLSIARPRLVRAAQQFNFAFHYLEQRLMESAGGHGAELQLSQDDRLRFAELLLQGSNLPDILELQHRFIEPMQGYLSQDYARRDYSTLSQDFPESLPRAVQTARLSRPVDVIVPVYAGVEQTKRCLESVLASAVSCPYELVLVLDHPDDKAMRQLVERIAREVPGVIKVVNSENKGFADSVNLAMKLHRDRDVVILHSDCEVHGDWIGRLRRAAYDGAGAGMVNPLTNQGEFLSYPSAGAPMPPDATLKALDDAAWNANRHQTVQIPAAMGFCLYIRRGCLEELGFFHNDRPSGGYFAEKYFSVNAAAQGWRSILATDVFVLHQGNVSFAKRNPRAVEKAREAFELWCPYYQDTVTDFLVDDPVAPAKRELDLARLEACSRDRFCFISHGVGGGTERHLKDLGDAIARNSVRALVLFSLPGRRVFMAAPELQGIENLKYRLDSEWGALVRDLKRLRVRHVHVHSNVEVDPLLFTLPQELGVEYDVTVHDYAWFCPRVNLVNHSGVYCGEPPVSVCSVCTGTDVARLRDTSHGQLASARQVYCPSEDARQRMARHFELSNLSVRPHPESVEKRSPKRAKPDGIIRVATIGRIATHKGLGVLRQCAAHALDRALPIRFIVIGGVTNSGQFKRLTNVEITGSYEEQEVDDLVAHSGARVALLPSVWPETYSYTLSIALRNGLFPVAFDLGAIAERLRAAGTGLLLPLGTPVAEINQALLTAGRKDTSGFLPQGFVYQDMLRDYYGMRS